MLQYYVAYFPPACPARFPIRNHSLLGFEDIIYAWSIDNIRYL